MASSGKQALVGRRERTSLKAPVGEATCFQDPHFLMSAGQKPALSPCMGIFDEIDDTMIAIDEVTILEIKATI